MQPPLRHTVRVLAVLVLGFGHAAAQGAAPAGESRLTPADDEYVAAVSLYVQGKQEQALGEATRWPAAEVPVAAKRVPVTDARLLIGAALLHVDAAGRLEDAGARAHRAAAYVSAMRVAADDAPALDPALRRDAVLVVATALHAVLDTAGVDLLLDRALKAFPGDPDLLVARGSLAESLVAMGPRARTHDRVEEGVMAAARLAAADYERALEGNPNHVEARIRLGRVQLQLGRLRAARETLERARQDAPAGPLGYFAALLLGSAHESLDRTRDAEACYAAALELFPQAQVPHIALAHLRHHAGRTTAARQQVSAMAGRAGLAISDPWWVYDYGQLWSLEDRKAALRQRIGS
jgi:tetratricopeptide (TPR) repeat protein